MRTKWNRQLTRNFWLLYLSTREVPKEATDTVRTMTGQSSGVRLFSHRKVNGRPPTKCWPAIGKAKRKEPISIFITYCMAPAEEPNNHVCFICVMKPAIPKMSEKGKYLTFRWSWFTSVSFVHSLDSGLCWILSFL